MASVFSDPNNPTPVVTPADEWCDAVPAAEAGPALPARRPPLPRQPRIRENNLQIARRIETRGFVQPPAPPPREGGEPRLKVQEIGAAVIRLEPPPPAQPLPPRQGIAPLPMAAGSGHRPRGESRRLRTLRLRRLAAGLLTALAIAAVIFIKTRQTPLEINAAAPDAVAPTAAPGTDPAETLPATDDAISAATPPDPSLHPGQPLDSNP